MRYGTEVGTRIAEKIAVGGLPADFLKGRDRDKTLPTLPTYRRWRHQHPEFASQVEAALLESTEVLVVEMRDVKEELRGELDLGAIRSCEVRLRHLEWLVSRMDREKWGPSQKLEVTALPVVRIRDYTGVDEQGKSRPRLSAEPKVLPASVAESIEPPNRRRVEV